MALRSCVTTNRYHKRFSRGKSQSLPGSPSRTALPEVRAGSRQLPIKSQYQPPRWSERLVSSRAMSVSATDVASDDGGYSQKIEHSPSSSDQSLETAVSNSPGAAAKASRVANASNQGERCGARVR